MNILQRGNDALNVNPATGIRETLSVNGSDWLWAVTAIYAAAFVGFTTLSFGVHESKRVFHYIFTIALIVGTVTYFAEASNLGWSPIGTEESTHQLFFAKYINWAISFPSLVLALGLLSGISWTSLVCNIFIAWIWVLTYLAAAYTATDYKWGFFTIGTFVYIILALGTLKESYESAAVIGIGRDYMILSAWVNVLWILFPVAFALSDGSNTIGITSGLIFFGILDVLMVPVLSFLFVLLARKWDFKHLNLGFSAYRGEREEDRVLDKATVSTAAGDATAV